MRRQVSTLAALHLLLAGLLAGTAWSTWTHAAPTMAAVPFAVAVALVGSMRINVELGRHACSVTMVEAVVVAMLMQLGPAEVVLAALLGEVLACAWQRQAPTKLLYNASSAVLAGTLAVVVFNLLNVQGAAIGVQWVAALTAGCCYATATHASTSAVLALVEGSRFGEVFTASMVPVAIASIISATIGLVAVVLHSVSPGAVVLIAPLVLIMVAETRRLAIQRAGELRFERLYAASSRTGVLTNLPEVMATLAEEARSLVTGAAGVCCTATTDGQWVGLVVGDGAVRTVPASSIAALRALTGARAAVEVDAGSVPPDVRALLPSTESLVVARTDADSAAPVLLAVLRQLAREDHTNGRAEVLGAFIGHAALTVANARLYADIESALAHQVDLNRQKDEFVSVVSHELRTPLAAMIGSVLTIRRLDGRLGAEQRASLLDMSVRQAKRLQRLIEELLTLANVENADPPRLDEEVDSGAMVGEILHELRTQRGGQDLPPVTFSDAGVGLIRSSEPRLRQVVSNLIENACKYAPDADVRVLLSHGDAGTIRLEVIDGGPGIPEADRERVFERFVQLDQTSTRSQGGTGLGLYLCRQVASVLGGTLVLSEAAGGGCRFRLTLPHPTGSDRRAGHHDRDGAGLAVASTTGRSQ